MPTQDLGSAVVALRGGWKARATGLWVALRLSRSARRRFGQLHEIRSPAALHREETFSAQWAVHLLRKTPSSLKGTNRATRRNICRVTF